MSDPTIADLSARISAIELRNNSVSADKAWETSITRRASIAALTYLVAAAFLATTGNANWYQAALFPPVGYLLSTLTMRKIKSVRLKKREK